MSRKKELSLNLDPQAEKILSLGIGNLDKITELLAFSSLAAYMINAYDQSPITNLGNAGLAFLLIKSGTEIGVTTVVVGMGLQEIFHKKRN